MKVVHWGEAPKESWRAGSETRLHASALTGTEHLCVGEQWFEPGVGTPPACHAAGVEEVISVLEGTAQVHVGDEMLVVSVGQSVIIPGGAVHQLVAINNEPLRIWFALSAPAPIVFLADGSGDTFTIGGTEDGRVISVNPRTDQ
jgi:mannose-6-phosphate isomerase-like protein (cupin superfamily)